MKQPGDFLRSIQKQHSQLFNTKKEIVILLEKRLQVLITEDMFIIQDSKIHIKPNPYLLSKILIHKKEIEKELSQICNKKMTIG
jgi:hypothetical protein